MLRIGILAIAILGVSSVANASSHCSTLIDAEFGCACAVPLEAFDPASTAILSKIVGDVDVTTANQYSPVSPPMPLNVGDGVLVAEDSSAFLSFGPTCSRQLPAQSSLVIRAVDGCACASVVEAQRVARSQNLAVTHDTQSDEGDRRGGAWFAGLLAAGAIGGGVYLLSAQDGDDDGLGDPVTPD